MQTVTNRSAISATISGTKASGNVQGKVEQVGGNTLPSSSSDSVTLSQQGKSLLAKEQKQQAEDQGKTMQDTVTSFAHGALGMDHPDTIEEREDSSYSAGQYTSAAITIGSILLALV